MGSQQVPRPYQRMWLYADDGKTLVEEKVADAQGLVSLGEQPEKVTIGFTLTSEYVNTQFNTKVIDTYFIYRPIANTRGEIVIKDSRSFSGCMNKTQLSIVARVPNKVVKQFYIQSMNFNGIQMEQFDGDQGRTALYEVCLDRLPAQQPLSIRLVATTDTAETYLYKSDNFNLNAPEPIILTAQERSELAEVRVHSQTPLHIYEAPAANGDEFALGEDGLPLPKLFKQSYFPSENIGGLNVSISASRQDGAFLSYRQFAPVSDTGGYKVNIPLINEKAEYNASSDSFSWLVNAYCPGVYNSITLNKSEEQRVENGMTINARKTVDFNLPADQATMLVPQLPAEFEMRPGVDTGVRFGYFIFIYPQGSGSTTGPNCAMPTNSWIISSIF